MPSVKLTYWPTTRVHLNKVHSSENQDSLVTEHASVDAYKQVIPAIPHIIKMDVFDRNTCIWFNVGKHGRKM